MSFPDPLTQKARNWCRRDRQLFESVLLVEKDEQLNAEMVDWDVTVGDGLETETW